MLRWFKNNNFQNKEHDLNMDDDRTCSTLNKEAFKKV